MTAARYALKPDQLDRIVHMNGPVYQRVRAACCNEHGLTDNRELNRHAAAIVAVISSDAYTTGSRRTTLDGKRDASQTGEA